MRHWVNVPKPHQKIWETAKSKFEDEGLTTELHLTEKVGHASEIAYTLKDRSDIKIIVACGGDGTIHEVASGLRGSNIPLAKLPTGRGKDGAPGHGEYLIAVYCIPLTPAPGGAAEMLLGGRCLSEK